MSLVTEESPSQHSVILGVIESQSAEVVDVTKEINGLMDLPHLEEDGKEDIYDDFDFQDDVTGGRLGRKLAVEARKLEMDFFRKLQVYTKFPEGMQKQLDAR